MKVADYTIDQEDLKCLFASCMHLYIDFNHFVSESKKGYEEYLIRSENNKKRFSQWINGQTMALNY